MAIKDFEFPGVELHQEFVETQVTGTPLLGVAVVGKKFRSNTTAWVYGGTASTIDTAQIDNCTAYDYDDVTFTIQDGLFANFQATTTGSLKIDSSTVTEGNIVTANFNASITSGAAATTAFGTAVPTVGDAVTVVAGSTSTGVIQSITGGTTAVIEITGNTLSGSTASSITFMKIADAELEGVTMSGTTASFPASVTAKIGGKDTTSALETGTYNIQLKYDTTTDAFEFGAVGSLSAIREAFGEIAAGNDMSLAVAAAFQAANGNIVYYVGIKEDSADGYEAAMDYLAKYDQVYSIVPVTYDTTSIKNCISMAETASVDPESKIRRTVWYGLETPATNVVANLIAARKDTSNSYRAQAVWADGIIYRGSVVPNYVVAAAAAGMRCGEPSYRPISNLGYSFFSMPDSSMTKSDLLQLGADGIWIVANNFDGLPINLKQVTTAVSNNINKDEESIVANADSIALTLCHVGENLVGCSNISPMLIISLSDTITGIMDRYLLNLSGNVYVGPQLLSWNLDDISQDPVQLDHIYATITCEPPKPFNRFVMTLRIV